MVETATESDDLSSLRKIPSIHIILLAVTRLTLDCEVVANPDDRPETDTHQIACLGGFLDGALPPKVPEKDSAPELLWQRDKNSIKYSPVTYASFDEP